MTLCKALLAFSLVVSSAVTHAKSFVTAVDAYSKKASFQTAYTDLQLDELKRRLQRGSAAAAKTPSQVLPHVAQTLTLLWILGGIEAVRQNQKFADLQTQTTSNSALILQVGDHLINGIDLFSGMAGASVTSMLLQKPLGSLNQLIQGQVTRPMLQSLITAGASSFVTFVGWEAGMKLWEEAIFLLEPEEIAAAKKLRFTEVMTGRAPAADQALFQKLLVNAFGILTWARPEVSSMWIYNTWRHRIATGEFVTLVTSMVTAGTLAGSLAPGAGTVVGFCFGLAGGLAGGLMAIYLPHSVKQPVTDGFRRLRMDHHDSSLNGFTYRLRAALTHPQTSLQTKKLKLGFLTDRQRQSRNQWVTAGIEQVYDAFLRRQEAEAVLQILMTADPVTEKQAAKMIELRTEYQAQLIDANERLWFYLNETLGLYRKEALSLGNLAYTTNLNAELQQALLAKLQNLSEMYVYLRNLAAGLMPEKAESLEIDIKDPRKRDELRASAQIFLNLVYLRSFDESAFVGAN